MPKSAQGRPLRLVVCGALGRMGRRVTDLAARDRRFSMVAGIVSRPGAAAPGALSRQVPRVRSTTLRAAPFSTATGSRASEYFKQADVIVDFSTPAASAVYARLAAKLRKPIVIGTTGLTGAQMASVRACARKTPIFLSPNFSRGMNLLFHLARRAASALPDYDAAILETHHAQKKDSPSGSALQLARAVEQGKKSAVKVPIASQRIGAVVGEHTLSLAGPFECVEFVHRAGSRDAFAGGALDAALWLRGRRPGLYGMQDLLGLGGS